MICKDSVEKVEGYAARGQSRPENHFRLSVNFG